MSARPPAFVTAIVAAVAVIAAAPGCSDSDEPETDAVPYVDAMVVSLTTQQPGELLWAYSEDEAACIAEHVVDVVGVDFFIDNGITAGELEGVANITDLGVALDEEQATEAAEAWIDCDISFGRYFTAGNGSQNAVECINDMIDVDAIAAAAAARLSGNEVEAQALSQPLMGAVTSCLTTG